jgi:hypothetical protein
MNQAAARRFLPLALAALVVACGGSGPAKRPAITHTSAPPPEQQPNAGDYSTIRIASGLRDEALFRHHDWRVKSYTATLALRTLLTVRLAAGPCATYVTELYGNLRDLADAYNGEDWRPLVRVVRRQPKFKDSCASPNGPKLRVAGPGLVA